jgi:hypothetical protein
MNRENRLIELLELLLAHYQTPAMVYFANMGKSYQNALDEVLSKPLIVEVGKVYQLTDAAVLKRETNSQIKTKSNLVYILSQNSAEKWLANYVSDSNVITLVYAEDLEPIQYEYGD